jgi:hypothetical protein
MNRSLRLWICFVGGLLLLGIAVPRLPVYGSTIELGFSLLWIAFCLLVIGANLYALMRLGRGELLQRPRLNREQKEAIRRIGRYRARRMHSDL